MRRTARTCRRRRVVAAVAGVVVAATMTLASCSTGHRPPALSQVEVTARLEAHFAEVRQALDGQATLESDDRFPKYQVVPCDDNDLHRDSPVNVDRQYLVVAAVPEAQVISTLHRYWLGHGWQDNDHDDSAAVGVTSSDGYRFYIGRDSTGLTITGSAPCATRTP